MSGKIKHERSPEVQTWLDEEGKEQKARYAAIVRKMDELGLKRDEWVEEFLQRIQTRGFNVNGDMRIKIPAKKIPKKPGRKFKVVF